MGIDKRKERRGRLKSNAGARISRSGMKTQGAKGYLSGTEDLRGWSFSREGGRRILF
jgi:hypothetical protein